MLKNNMSNELYYVFTIGLGTLLFISGMILVLFVVRSKCEKYNDNGTCSKRSNEPMSTTTNSVYYISGIILLSVGIILLFLPIMRNLYKEWFGTEY